MFRKNSILPTVQIVILAIAAIILQGCSSNNHIYVEQDPFESVNRKVYAFNNAVDNAVARPVATAYEKHVPLTIQIGVHNFFNNIDDVAVSANNILQLKLSDASSDLIRLTINTTVGVLGVMDFATSWGFEKHVEDLNQTFGYWGVPDGPYIVMPILGSYSTRGVATGLIQNGYLIPIQLIHETSIRNSLTFLDVFDARVHLLLASEILDSAAIDPYTYVRESFLQRQKNLIYDGNPPEEDFDELDFLD